MTTPKRHVSRSQAVLPERLGMAEQGLLNAFYGLLVIACLTIQSTRSHAINITFDPPELVVKVRDTLLVQFNVTILDVTAPSTLDNSSFGKLDVLSIDPGIATVTNGSIELNWQNAVGESRTFQFSVSGQFTGRTTLKIWGWKLPDYGRVLVAEYPVAVLRMSTMARLSLVFTITMFTLIVINTFVMGLQLDWRVILNVFRRPTAPIIGFGCQYVIMPLVATGWAFALLTGVPYLQFGYFAVGCAPGGGNSNFWTLLLDGNLDLSVTMTFCSNMAALAMMPFWLYTLGRVFFMQAGGERLKIPFLNIIVSLLLLIGPVFAGIVLKHYRPQFAEKSKKFVKISTVIIIMVAIVFGSISNFYVYYLLTWKTLLCGLLLPWAGFAISYTVGFLLGQGHRNCRTIAIETGIQNAGIAIVLLQTSLSPPESDLALVMPVCVLIFTPLPLLVALITKTVLNCVRTRKEKEALANKGSVQSDVDGIKHRALDASRESDQDKDGGISRVGARYSKEVDGPTRDSEEVRPMIASTNHISDDEARARRPD